MGAEQRVGGVPALGCLDEGKVDAIGAGGGPIDRSLKFRQVDAVDGVIGGADAERKFTIHDAK